MCLAPIKVQAVFDASVKSIAAYQAMGKTPTPGGAFYLVLDNLLDVEAERSDIQWLIDAEMFTPEFMSLWEDARG